MPGPAHVFVLLARQETMAHPTALVHMHVIRGPPLKAACPWAGQASLLVPAPDLPGPSTPCCRGRECARVLQHRPGTAPFLGLCLFGLI